MASTTNTLLTTISHSVTTAARFTTRFSQHSSFLFVGQSSGQQNAAPDAVDGSNKGVQDAFDQMQFGKRVFANNVAQLIPSHTYQSNHLYDMYDDIDANLFSKAFYVNTTEGSYHHVFKCLDNNLGANSTIQPAFSDIVGSNTEVYQTADGYRWKYMYSFDNTANDHFASTDYIPIVPNTAVSNTASRGAIDVIRIEDVGRGYDNYVTGTFTSSDLRVNGDSTIYQVSNATVSTVNGFYTGCGIYISSGSGAGQYRKITDYISNANGNFIVINTFFDISPTNGSQFEVYPDVIVTGTGDQTENVIARALVNSTASNSIYRVEIIDRGLDYTYATANVIANSVVSVIRTAQLRPIIPPGSGHGRNPWHELGASRIGLYAEFANSEANTIPTSNQFRQVGLIEDPLFYRVLVNLSGRSGSFVETERVASISPKRLFAGVNVAGSNVSCNTANLLSLYTTGDYVYLLANGIAQHLTTVNVVTNSTFLTISNPSSFTSANAEIFLVSPTEVGTVVTFDGGANLTLTDASPTFYTNTILVGLTSSAIGTVNSTYRQNVPKTAWSTFVQMYKFIGAVTFGSFIPNETVFQTNLSTANAILHSVSIDSGTMTMYATNKRGRFAAGTSVVGNTSSALASVTSIYRPEVIPGSGKVLYLENRTAVLRQNNQTEHFKIVIAF